MKPNWLGKFLMLLKWLMVAKNINAIRHGTLIKVQVQLQEKYSTNVIERVQNKIIRISKAYILYKLILEQKMKVLSENDIETVQTPSTVYK